MAYLASLKNDSKIVPRSGSFVEKTLVLYSIAKLMFAFWKLNTAFGDSTAHHLVIISSNDFGFTGCPLNFNLLGGTSPNRIAWTLAAVIVFAEN